MAYGLLLLACNTFSTNPQLARLTLPYQSHTYLPYMDLVLPALHACMLCVLITLSCWLSLHVFLGWLCQLSQMSEHIYISYTDILYQNWIFLYFFMAMLLKRLTTASATLCIVSASHVHAIILPWVPTYPLLGCTPSILKILVMMGTSTMLKDLLNLIFCIIIYQCQIQQEVLSIVSL